MQEGESPVRLISSQLKAGSETLPETKQGQGKPAISPAQRPGHVPVKRQKPTRKVNPLPGQMWDR